jgi:hypothetical protein
MKRITHFLESITVIIIYGAIKMYLLTQQYKIKTYRQ